MLYADADAAGRLNFKPDELALLKTLRNQAVLAIRQHSA
jgi:GAF domain-containing protein